MDKSGPKSIIAPIPIKSSNGNASEASMPVWYNHDTMPFTSPTPCRVWFSALLPGRLTRIAPNPMGSRSAGSYCFLMASQIKMPPTAYITSCCQVTDKIPSRKKVITTSLFCFLCFQLSWSYNCRRKENKKGDLHHENLTVSVMKVSPFQPSAGTLCRIDAWIHKKYGGYSLFITNRYATIAEDTCKTFLSLPLFIFIHGYTSIGNRC